MQAAGLGPAPGPLEEKLIGMRLVTNFQVICIPTRPFLEQQTSSNTGALACVGNSIDFYLKLT